ncbi:MAG: LCP family protein [Terrimesophilobacter sp.]
MKLVAAVVAVVVVSTGGVVAFAVVETVSAIKPGIHLATLPGQSARPVPAVGSIEGSVNVLLTGTDTRTGQGGPFNSAAELAGSSGAGNNDVTMVLHIAADHKSAVVVSIPRDLLVSIPRCPDGKGFSPAASMQMFNTTLSRGGLSCVVLAAEKLTGLSIPYAAEISFDGVIAMSNAVGGVTVCLATRVVDRYSGLDLAAGQQTLVGAKALAFVRSRHGIGDGSDLGRISNQQLFLSALLRKITSAGVLSNPVTLFSLAHATLSNMQLSDTLSQPTTLVAIALALKNLSLNNIVFVQYPSRSDPAYPGRVVPDSGSANILNAALVADQQVQLTGKVGPAAVVSLPASPAAPSAPPTPSASAPSSPAPSASAPPSTVVALPSNITGQTASEQTCTKGNR